MRVSAIRAASCWLRAACGAVPAALPFTEPRRESGRGPGESRGAGSSRLGTQSPEDRLGPVPRRSGHRRVPPSRWASRRSERCRSRHRSTRPHRGRRPERTRRLSASRRSTDGWSRSSCSDQHTQSSHRTRRGPAGARRPRRDSSRRRSTLDGPHRERPSPASARSAALPDPRPSRTAPRGSTGALRRRRARRHPHRRRAEASVRVPGSEAPPSEARAPRETRRRSARGGRACRSDS